MTKWWLIGAAAILAVLLVASIVLALTSKETEFAPGTPERAVQDLLRSAEADDIETAYTVCSPQNFKTNANSRTSRTVEDTAPGTTATSAPPCATPKSSMTSPS